MTSPKHAVATEFGRHYQNIPGFEGESLASVTNIIGIMDKPGLTGWAAKLAAERAVTNDQVWHAIQVEEGEAEAIKWIANASREAGARAMNLGSAVHLACEYDGEPPMEKVRPFLRDMGGDEMANTALVAQHVAQYLNWIKDFCPLFLERERTVFNVKDGWAGTLDMVVEIDGEILVGDIKSGGVYAESAALQLNAYANAEWKVVGDHSSPFGHKIDGAFVLQLKPRSYKFLRVTVSPDIYKTFLSARDLWLWKHEGSRGVMG